MISAEMKAHLETGITTICRCWSVLRSDGVVLGFTDHDSALEFGGLIYEADSGMSARTLSQTTGLSVDNTEALGVLSHSALTEADIQAGRYDGAKVYAWLVNWADVAQRAVQFQGTIGEISRSGGAFEAELRGLAETLNQSQGRVYQRPCSAVLGDQRCRFDTMQAGYMAEFEIAETEDGSLFRFDGGGGYADRWFDSGRLEVLTGEAAGLTEMIKNDRLTPETREIELWQAIRAGVAAGDRVRVIAGCDKRTETCKVKFNNFLNFQGFPHVPGEDWLVSYPVRGKRNNGGSRNNG